MFFDGKMYISFISMLSYNRIFWTVQVRHVKIQNLCKYFFILFVYWRLNCFCFFSDERKCILCSISSHNIPKIRSKMLWKRSLKMTQLAILDIDLLGKKLEQMYVYVYILHILNSNKLSRTIVEFPKNAG